jgi:hypothetical protein
MKKAAVNSETRFTQSEAVAAWTLHYEADLGAAVRRVGEMREHGIPEGHVGEWLGATQALTPREHRCAHFGDDRICPQCAGERRQARREAERERAARTERLKAQSDVIDRQSEALERQSAEIRRLRAEKIRMQLRAEKIRMQRLMAARRPRRRLFRRDSDGPRRDAPNPRADRPGEPKPDGSG